MISIRDWINFLKNTVLISALSTVVIGSVAELFIQRNMGNLTATTLVAMISSYMILGGMFGLLSHLGFFGYIFFRRTMLNIIRSNRVWQYIQVVLILYFLLDLLFLKHWIGNQVHIRGYYPIVVLFIIGSLIVSLFKGRQSGLSAFLPALLYMFVGTILEWAIVRDTKILFWTYTILVVLFITNSYQILSFYKMGKKPE